MGTKISNYCKFLKRTAKIPSNDSSKINILALKFTAIPLTEVEISEKIILKYKKQLENTNNKLYVIADFRECSRSSLALLGDVTKKIMAFDDLSYEKVECVSILTMPLNVIYVEVDFSSIISKTIEYKRNLNPEKKYVPYEFHTNTLESNKYFVSVFNKLK